MTAILESNIRSNDTYLGHSMDADLAEGFQHSQRPLSSEPHHFVMVLDDDEVLGVWESIDELDLAKLRLRLALSFPDCHTLVCRASSFEEFRKTMVDADFHGVVLEADFAF